MSETIGQIRRGRVAGRANAIARQARYGGAPALSADSSREDLCAWLQWCDPNGEHTDEHAAAADCDPYSLEGAWDAVESMLEGSDENTEETK